MIYWVLLAVLILAIGGWIVFTVTGFMGWFGKFFAVIGELIAGVLGYFLVILIASLCAMAVPNYTLQSQSSIDLVALKTKDSVDGRLGGTIFASYGTLKNKRVVSYITRDTDGAMKIGTLDARNVTLYEKTDKPTLTTYTWIKNAWWVGPANIVGFSTNFYVIVVPEGSVVNDYEVAP